MADRSVKVTLRAEIGQYKAAMREAAQSTKGLSDEGKKASVEGKNFVDSWSRAGTPLLAAGGAITALTVSVLKTGVAYNQLQQQSRAALTTLLGSATAANAQMDKLDEFARSSPFSKSVFIQAQQQMLAFGIETQKVLPYLDAIQDAVAAAGGGNQDISELSRIMSQIHASAKITATDLREFGNRGVDAAGLIGQAMGKTGAQIRQDITAGTLDAGAALDALAAGMEAKFDGAADNVKNTFTGALDRITAAWRDLSSTLAEPFVGTEGGGIFTALLNQTADFLRLIEGLPTPVLMVAGGVTALAGGAMLAAGAFLTFAPRIIAVQASLNKLAADGSRAAVAIQRTGSATATAGKHAGRFVAAAAALGIAVNVFSDDSIQGVNTWTEAILKGSDAVDALAKGNVDNWFFNMGEDGLAGSIQDAEKATGAFQKTLGIFGLNMRERGANEVKAFDQALSALVADGKLDEAARGAEMFAREAADGGVSAEKASEMLVGYNDALAKTRIEAQGTGDSVAQLAKRQEAAREVVKQVREDALKQAEGFITLGKSLNDSKVSLADWTKELRNQAKALEDFTANARQAAKKGLDDGLIASLREAGPEGAMRLEQLAGASEKEIARANAAWRRGQDAIAAYVDDVARVPEKKVTTLEVKTVNAQAISVFRDAINSLPRSWTTDLRVNRTAPNVPRADGGFVGKRFADGGIDEFGRPVQRVPQIRSGSQGTVMWGEPETGWEAYVSGKPSQKPRNRSILSEAAARLGGSVQWFADGGFTEALDRRDLLDLKMSIRDMRRDFRATEKVGKNKRKRFVVRGMDRAALRMDLFEAQRELKEQQNIRKQIGKGKKYRSAGAYNKAMERAETARDTASSFAADFDSNAFRSPASLERVLATKLRESAEFTQTLAALRKKGASKWLIDQLIEVGPSRSTNRTAKALLTDTERLKRLNAMAGQLGAVSGSYASVVAGGGLSAAQSRALASAAAAGGGSGVVNLSPNSVQEVATAILAGSRNVSVRTVDDREYRNASNVRYPSPVAGVLS